MKTSPATTTEVVWRERVRAWRASGETAESFAQGRGYAASTLRSWSSRLGPLEPPSFVRLMPKAPATPAPPELVVEVGGARVRVGPGFDPVLLGAVIKALGAQTP